jgi:hypothetical protein
MCMPFIVRFGQAAITENGDDDWTSVDSIASEVRLEPLAVDCEVRVSLFEPHALALRDP